MVIQLFVLIRRTGKLSAIVLRLDGVLWRLDQTHTLVDKLRSVSLDVSRDLGRIGDEVKNSERHLSGIARSAG